MDLHYSFGFHLNLQLAGMKSPEALTKVVIILSIN